MFTAWRFLQTVIKLAPLRPCKTVTPTALAFTVTKHFIQPPAIRNSDTAAGWQENVGIARPIEQ